MDCSEIKNIVPAYLANAATAEEVAKAEEHLAVCQECRQYLSKMMDAPVVTVPRAAAPVYEPEPVQEPVPLVKERPIEKIKAKSIDDQLTPLDYGVLIAGILILGFLLSLFAKK